MWTRGWRKMEKKERIHENITREYITARKGGLGGMGNCRECTGSAVGHRGLREHIKPMQRQLPLLSSINEARAKWAPCPFRGITPYLVGSLPV